MHILVQKIISISLAPSQKKEIEKWLLRTSVQCIKVGYNFDVMHALFKTQSRFIAMVSSLIARWWVRPQSLWRLWRKALIGRLVPNKYL